MEFELIDFATARLVCQCRKFYVLFSPGCDTQAHIVNGESPATAEKHTRNFMEYFSEEAHKDNSEVINIDETPVLTCSCGASFDVLARFQSAINR
jgi:hypothetical protein